MGLYKGHHGNGTPGTNRIKVHVQISRPRARHCIGLPLAWAEADADPAEAVA
jgi:hypothetical protein